MSWIDEAIENGWKRVNSAIEAEKQASQNKQLFESEKPVTEAEVNAVLNQFKKPIESITQELTQAGFKIEENVGYLYDADIEDVLERNYIEQFALSKIKQSFREITNYRVAEYHIFGSTWSIQDEQDEYVGTIRLYPIVNEHTHYAGVLCRVQKGDRRNTRLSIKVTTATELAVLTKDLQRVLGVLIQEVIVQNASKKRRKALEKV